MIRGKICFEKCLTHTLFLNTRSIVPSKRRSRVWELNKSWNVFRWIIRNFVYQPNSFRREKINPRKFEVVYRFLVFPRIFRHEIAQIIPTYAIGGLVCTKLRVNRLKTSVDSRLLYRRGTKIGKTVPTGNTNPIRKGGPNLERWFRRFATFGVPLATGNSEPRTNIRTKAKILFLFVFGTIFNTKTDIVGSPTSIGLREYKFWISSNYSIKNNTSKSTFTKIQS